MVTAAAFQQLQGGSLRGQSRCLGGYVRIQVFDSSNIARRRPLRSWCLSQVSRCFPNSESPNHTWYSDSISANFAPVHVLRIRWIQHDRVPIERSVLIWCISLSRCIRACAGVVRPRHMGKSCPHGIDSQTGARQAELAILTDIVDGNSLSSFD